SELTAVVDVTRPDIDRFPFSVGERKARHRYTRADGWLARIINDATGDHSTWWHREVDLGHDLTIGESDRSPRAIDAPLPVCDVSETGLRRAQLVSSFGKVRDLVFPVIVGHHRLAVLRRDEHECPSQRLPRVGSDDPS